MPIDVRAVAKLPLLKIALFMAVGIGGLASFFLLMSVFNIFDSKIQYNNPTYMAKMTLALSSLPLTHYGWGYILGGHKRGVALAAPLVITLLVAFVIGYVNHL